MVATIAWIIGVVAMEVVRPSRGNEAAAAAPSMVSPKRTGLGVHSRTTRPVNSFVQHFRGQPTG